MFLQHTNTNNNTSFTMWSKIIFHFITKIQNLQTFTMKYKLEKNSKNDISKWNFGNNLEEFDLTFLYNIRI